VKPPEEIERELQHFSGSEMVWAHWTHGAVYTDGVRYLAQAAEAYWLIDAIVSHQGNNRVKREDFQVWKLRLVRPKDHKAMPSWELRCEDGNHNEVVTQHIEWSTFPLPNGIDIWLVNGTLLLPGEY
jgi:hypothetical protein